MAGSPDNPFRIHGVVTSPYFTNRAAELGRIRKALTEPGAKLVVYGPRRMGKTSALAQALEQLEQQGGVAFMADLSTASTLVDMANRLLEAAAAALGRRWKDAINDFVQRLGISLSLRPDAATGLVIPSLDIQLRSAPEDAQRKSFAATLDAIDALAAARGQPIGVVLDEFQEIHRFGGENAEWHLRGTIQHHQHVSYILAGSESHLIRRMMDQGRAFYGLADLLEFGPMDPDHLSRWIDDRMTGAGVRAEGAGARAVSLAGPRTRDIVQLSRQCFDNRVATGHATAADIEVAFDDVVAEQEPLLAAAWSDLTAMQQNVLRAVAADLDGLTTADSLRRFGLPSTGSAANTAAALVDAGLLLKPADTRTGYAFDSPFFRRWVVVNTLGDVGLPST